MTCINTTSPLDRQSRPSRSHSTQHSRHSVTAVPFLPDHLYPTFHKPATTTHPSLCAQTTAVVTHGSCCPCLVTNRR
jgi:hypothetical protein